jgi:DNA-binding CsgD family transcriptional regulator
LLAIETFVATEGGFGVLVLEGEAGIGKTTLWTEGVRRLHEAGAIVLAARPAEAETALSFSGLIDLFGAVPGDVLDRLPEPQQLALRAARLEAPTPSRGIDEAALFAGVLSMLRMLAADSTVVVAVDDVQWLDSATARALGYATRRLDAEPVRFLAAVRVVGPPPTTFLSAIHESQRRVLEVGPMSLAALHEVVRFRTGVSIPRPTFVRVARASGGNPFYALEIATALDRGSLGDDLPVPVDVTGLVESRLTRLPTATRRALLVAAALAQPTTEIVDADALAAAEDAGILSIDQHRIRFAHPLFASAVYAQAHASERRRLHRRLASLVDDPEDRARHLALSALRPDEAIAGDIANAAFLAGARGAPDAAARLSELAVGSTPRANAAARSERLLSAAHFWFEAGDFTRALALVEELLERVPEPPIQARALQILCQVHARRSSFAEAFAFAQRALESAGDDPRLRAGMELDVAYCSASMGDFEGARAHALAAVSGAESEGDAQVLADALGALTIAEFMGGAGLDEARLERALALEDPAWPGTFVLRPSYIHGCLLLWSGRVEEALAVHEALRAHTLERGEESALPMLTLYLVWACLWEGDLARARQFARESRETAVLLGDPATQGIALAANALVHAYDGSAPLARQEAADALAIFDRLQWLPGTIWPLWALGLTDLSCGSPEAVDRSLGPLAELICSLGADVSLGVFLPEEIEALVEIGDTERADRYTCWLEQRAGELDRGWARALAGRCRGLLHAARRDDGAAIQALSDALAEHDQLDLPIERARTNLVLGRVLRRSGRRGRAKATLSEALATFEEVGARRWADRTRTELDRLGKRTPSADALTTTEARVAELAAEGLSNREIAERAFLTVKAVESNLTRVYRKLAIRSRSQLVRTLHAAADPSG